MLRVLGTGEAADELVACGLWKTTKDGYRFHDWDDFQETSDTVKKRREQAKERQRKARESRETERAQSQGESRVTDTVTSQEVSTPDPTRPDPTLNTSSEPTGSDVEPDRIDVKRLVAALVESLEARGVKTPRSLKAWSAEARRLLDIDKRPLDEALRVLAWSQQDEFWSKNILAMPSFRTKYDQLRLKAGEWKPPVSADQRLKDAWRNGYDRDLDQLAPEPFYVEWPDPIPEDRDAFRLKLWRSWIESNREELLRKLESQAS
jgi:hypothetical protein